MKCIILVLLLFISCSDLYPTVETKIEWCDIVGTTWELRGSPNIVQNEIQQWTFSNDSLFWTIRKYNSETGQMNAERLFKGYVRDMRGYLEPEDKEPLVVFLWCRKEYWGSKYNAPVTDYVICDQWFLWKIENGYLYFGYELDNEYYYFKLSEAAKPYKPW